MAGLPDALRPAVLCLHPGSAVRAFPRADRADRGGCLWSAYALRGAGASAAGADPQADDGAVCDRSSAADQPAGRSAGPRGILTASAGHLISKLSSKIFLDLPPFPLTIQEGHLVEHAQRVGQDADPPAESAPDKP